MYDASAKVPAGVLNGNVNQYGDFDQCLNTEANNRKFRTPAGTLAEASYTKLIQS